MPAQITRQVALAPEVMVIIGEGRIVNDPMPTLIPDTELVIRETYIEEAQLVWVHRSICDHDPDTYALACRLKSNAADLHEIISGKIYIEPATRDGCLCWPSTDHLNATCDRNR